MECKDYLVKWLYGFYDSHNAPHKMFTETIRKLTDRVDMQESKWDAALETALNRLKGITGWQVCEVFHGEGGAEPKVVIKKPLALPRRTRKAVVPSAIEE